MNNHYFRRKSAKSKRVSSNTRIVKSLAFFMIPFFAFLISYNAYNIFSLNSKLASVGHNLVQIYKSPIEDDVSYIQNTVVELMANDTDFQQMIYSKTNYEKYAYLQKVSSKCQQLLSIRKVSAGCIIYVSSSDMIKESYIGHNFSYNSKQTLRNLIRDTKKVDMSLQLNWQVLQVDDNAYIYKYYQKKGIYILTVYDLGSALNLSDDSLPDNSFLCFTDLTNVPLTKTQEISLYNIKTQGVTNKEYYISGSPHRFLLLQEQIGELPIRLLYIAPYAYLLGSSYYIGPTIFCALSFLLVALLIWFIKTLTNQYLSPFQNLVESMKSIREGNLDYRMTTSYNIEEFYVLSNEFNNMMDEIRSLKIASYEAKIEKQQAELQYLQIQMRPHFF